MSPLENVWINVGWLMVEIYHEIMAKNFLNRHECSNGRRVCHQSDKLKSGYEIFGSGKNQADVFSKMTPKTCFLTPLPRNQLIY